MPRLTDLELQIEDIPEHAAADAWKRLNIIAEAYISDGHHVTIARPAPPRTPPAAAVTVRRTRTGTTSCGRSRTPPTGSARAGLRAGAAARGCAGRCSGCPS